MPIARAAAVHLQGAHGMGNPKAKRHPERQAAARGEARERRRARHGVPRMSPAAPVRVDDSVLFLPLRELAARIAAKKLTSVALTERSLERLERLGPRYPQKARGTLTTSCRSARASTSRR